MFSQSKMHLVPQLIKDIATELHESKQISAKASYVERLQATRDYIDAVLVVTGPKSPLISKK